MRRPAARGLTLLELMVTLGILAVLASLALPSFGAMLARHRLQAAAEQLAQDLTEGRLQAARLGQPLQLDLQAGPAWCYALVTRGGCDCRVAQSCQLKTVRAADFPGVSLLAGAPLQIDPQPGASRGSALLQGDGGQQLRVALTPLGRAKVCAPEGPFRNLPRC